MKRRMRVNLEGLCLAVLMVVALTASGWAVEYIDGTWPRLQAGKPFAGTTIVVSTMEGWSCIAPAIERTGQFEELTGIKVDWFRLPGSELYAKQIMELSAHTGYADVVQQPGIFMLPCFPYLEPLDSYIAEGWGSIPQFEDEMWELQKQVKGPSGQYAMVQFHANAQVTYYRKELFEDPSEKAAFRKQYGYDLKVPETHQQLKDVATFFTRPPEMYGFIMNLGMDQGYTAQNDLYLETGRDWVEKVDGGYRVTYASGEGREEQIMLAQWLQDAIYKDKYMAPDSATLTTGPVSEYFFAGHAAMAWGWLSDFWGYMQTPEIKNKIGEIGTFRLPLPVSIRSGGHASYWGAGINVDSRRKDAAWEFIKWLMQEDIQLPMAKDAGQLPPYKKLAYYTSVDPGGINPRTLYDKYLEARHPYLLPLLGLGPFTQAADLHNLLTANKITGEEFTDRAAKATEDALDRAGLLAK